MRSDKGDIEGLGFCVDVAVSLLRKLCGPRKQDRAAGITWIGDVVLGVGKDFKRPGEIQEIHVVVHGDENLDGLIGLGVLNCTHLDGG